MIEEKEILFNRLGCILIRYNSVVRYLFLDISIGESAIVSDTDSLIGRLLHLSTIECPTLSKAWFTLAGWCYKWGRKSVDSAR